MSDITTKAVQAIHDVTALCVFSIDSLRDELKQALEIASKQAEALHGSAAALREARLEVGALQKDVDTLKEGRKGDPWWMQPCTVDHAGGVHVFVVVVPAAVEDPAVFTAGGIRCIHCTKEWHQVPIEWK